MVARRLVVFTGRGGRAQLKALFRRPGHFLVVASKAGYRHAARSILALRRVVALARLHLTARPAQVRTGRQARIVFKVFAIVGNHRLAIAGAWIRIAGRVIRTGRRGAAHLVLRFLHPGLYLATATKPGYLGARTLVRVRGRPFLPPVAHIYWGTGSTIGRANVDGSGVNRSFVTGASTPTGVAVDGQHVYWTNHGTGTIGRADLIGTAINQSFITGAASPDGLAVDAQHIYWGNGPGSYSVARANLDGSGVNQSFITGSLNPVGLALDGQHIYWADWSSTGSGRIGRANLDGSGVNHSFITTSSIPAGVAVDAQHIYWGNGSAIGRANLDGSGVNQTFITGVNGATGVAVDGQHVYWINHGNGTIGRANLDGTGVDESFIANAGAVWGVAVGG